MEKFKIGSVVKTNKHYDDLIKVCRTLSPMPGEMQVKGIKENPDGSKSLRFSDEKIEYAFGEGDCKDYDWTNECYFDLV